jgi:competence protein ComEA
MQAKWQQLFSLLSLTLLFVCANAVLAKKKPPPHPINLNTASAPELEMVPGIGPSTAQKILQTRKSYGAYKSVDDLLAIRGIGQKRLDKMRKYLTVGKPAVPTKKGTPSTPAAATTAKANAPPAKAATPNPAPPKKAPVERDDEEEQ